MFCPKETAISSPPSFLPSSSKDTLCLLICRGVLKETQFYVKSRFQLGQLIVLALKSYMGYTKLIYRLSFIVVNQFMTSGQNSIPAPLVCPVCSASSIQYQFLLSFQTSCSLGGLGSLCCLQHGRPSSTLRLSLSLLLPHREHLLLASGYLVRLWSSVQRSVTSYSSLHLSLQC